MENMENMENQNAQNNGTQVISDEDAQRIADSLAAALDNRRQRAERSVINSFARQNNLSPEILEGFLQQRSERRGETIPDDVQAMIDRRFKQADERLINAEIKEIGAQLGLIDAQAALAMMDRSGVRVANDGSVTGVLPVPPAARAISPARIPTLPASLPVSPPPDPTATTPSLPLLSLKLRQRGFSSDNAELQKCGMWSVEFQSASRWNIERSLW